MRLALSFGKEVDVRARLDELARQEAQVLELGDDVPRMHS